VGRILIQVGTSQDRFHQTLRCRRVGMIPAKADPDARAASL